ncbi:thiamine pyrophosphate-binding protein [Desulfococcaceae bacterium HSG9]|nr:thiamine pyrophosphate-binding protein [Desulfococcaceae bacterium HSG9]
MKNDSFNGNMQGGKILAKAMALKGINRVFSLCGGFLNPIYDGCLEYDVEVVGTRNEMEAGFMASATSRIRREPTVVLAEPSGFTNYISSVAEAFHSGDPVIFISVGSIFHRLDHMGFKEMPQHRVVESFTKYSFRITSGDRIHEFFDKAYDIAANLPTGPVQLSIPINFVFSHYEMGNTKRSFDISSKKVHLPPVHQNDLTLAADLLKDAKNPVIIAGAGIHQSHAEKTLESFSNRFQIPYFHSNHLEIRQPDFTQATYMGLADIHQNPASRLIHKKADVVLCLGTKMDYCLDFGESPMFNAESTLVCVNPTSRELSDNHIADHGILADSKIFLETLNEKLVCDNIDPQWCETIRARRIEENNKLLATASSNETPIHPLQASVDVLQMLTENDYLIVDGGDAHGWQETALNITSLENKNLKGLMMSGPFAQLGVGTSFATATKMAAPDSKVVVISGDGSFGLNPGLPLETAIHRNMQIVVVVLNNQAWGMIRNQQKAIWGRTCATDLRDVPFHKIAEAAGGYGELVENAEDLKPALQRAFESGVPALLNVKTQDVKSQLTIGLVDRRETSSIE